MKRSRASLRRITLLLAISLAGIFVIFCVLLPTLETRRQSREIAAALDNAKSVQIEEFILDPSDGLVYLNKRKDATPQHITAFRDATRSALTIEFGRANPRCYEPHHRLVINRPEGSTLLIEICLRCSNARIAGSRIRQMPLPWLERLEGFFADVGMPRRNREEYEAMKKSLKPTTMPGRAIDT